MSLICLVSVVVLCVFLGCFVGVLVFGSFARFGQAHFLAPLM